jgi:glycosyltransferase involved in cell wall biosynthesis
LDRTLRSAIAQRDVSVEIVIVDDGSKVTAPRNLVPSDCSVPVRIVRHATSLGVARARNRGAIEARGDWLAFLDDDDIWAPRKLSAQLAALERTAAQFAYSDALLVTADLEVLGVLVAPQPDCVVAELLQANAIPAGASNVVVAREVFADLGGFDETFSQLADWDLWLRLATRATAAVVHEYLVGYVQHSSNMLATQTDDILAEFRCLQRKHHPLTRELGQSLQGRHLAGWTAERHRRAGSLCRAMTTGVRAAIVWRDPRIAPWALRLTARQGARALARRSAVHKPVNATVDWLRDNG